MTSINPGSGVSSWASWLGVASVLAVLIGAPLVLSSFYVGLLVKMMVFAMFASSLNLILGYAGMPSLGHAAYFGLGAYTAVLVARNFSDNLILQLGSGVLVSVVAAIVFGLLVLRSQGAYLLMITLALAQLVWGLAIGWRELTGGDDGLPGVQRPASGVPWSLAVDGGNYYYFVLLVFVIIIAMIAVLVKSPFGCTLVGIRENEQRLQILGYNTRLYKLIACVFAGGLAGLAGPLLAYQNGFVGPVYLSVGLSASVLMMVILGGAGTVAGPVVGAFALVFLEHFVSAFTQRWLLVLGLIYISATLFAPSGLVGMLNDYSRRRAEGPAL